MKKLIILVIMAVLCMTGCKEPEKEEKKNNDVVVNCIETEEILVEDIEIENIITEECLVEIAPAQIK